VTKKPPGSSPGSRAFAMKPASRPRMIAPIMKRRYPFYSTGIPCRMVFSVTTRGSTNWSR
jgi:hypothetical protein